MLDPCTEEVVTVSMTQGLFARNVGYSIAMAVACLISYVIMTTVLSSVVATDNDVLEVTLDRATQQRHCRPDERPHFFAEAR